VVTGGPEQHKDVKEIGGKESKTVNKLSEERDIGDSGRRGKSGKVGGGSKDVTAGRSGGGRDAKDQKGHNVRGSEGALKDDSSQQPVSLRTGRGSKSSNQTAASTATAAEPHIQTAKGKYLNELPCYSA
jgi:hypothetical protein